MPEHLKPDSTLTLKFLNLVSRIEKKEIMWIKKNPGWLRKTSAYTILINILFTLAYLLAINHLGLNLAFLLAGFFISVAVIVFDWKKQMRRYDTLAQKHICDNSFMKKKYLK